MDQPANGQRELAVRETGEDTDNENPDPNQGGDPTEGEDRKTESKPRNIGGRRGRHSGTSGSGRRQQPSPFRPELICRKVPESATWEVVLTAADGQIMAVNLGGNTLDLIDGQCRIPSLYGRLRVSCRDGQERDVPLFESEPLLFKLRKNWAGEGRRISRITTGHFIVIAPDKWERTGRVPVEPNACADPSFRAHYFHRDVNTPGWSDGGFEQWNGTPAATGIELIGRQIHDDSDHGRLFVGDAPTLKSTPEIKWGRVGDEADHGWVRNFRPDKESLPEVLDGREGRFFLRVYDREVRLLDSEAFRHVCDLARIEVDGAEYAQGLAVYPPKTGYPRTEVRFIGMNGSLRTPVLPPEARQTVGSSGAIIVPPHPDADRISCSLDSCAGTVNIVVNLPRIWWRLEGGGSGKGDWRDTPLSMTREEFRNYAYDGGATLSLLSTQEPSIHAGFGNKPAQKYSRKIEDSRIEISLVHFVDHAQIDQRLNADACFNVEWAGETVRLIVISADPVPDIVSFAAEPVTILAGEEAVLEWKVRNAVDARVTIEPGAGVVDSIGTRTVRPAKSTRYTLTLAVSGAEEIASRTVMVAVDSPTHPGGQRAARVMSSAGTWRSGKGFSAAELRNAGLRVGEAAKESIPIDRRRRTSHRANVKAIRSRLDA